MSEAICAGYNYKRAVLRLRSRMTDSALAKKLGYSHRNSILKLVNGAIPLHPVGEAIYILYVETFGEKPA